MPQITLYQFPPVLGLPSMSPYCTKVHMAFKRKGVEFEIVNGFFAKRHNPRGKMPFVVWDGEGIEDSSAIVQAIDQRGSGPSLVPEDPRLAADAHLLEDWADESLYWYGIFGKYIDDEGWNRYRPKLRAAMPAALRAVGPSIARRNLTTKIRGHGLVSRAPELIRSEFERHIAGLSARLGTGPYLVGDAMTVADLAVAAMLLQFTTGTMPSFDRVIEAHPAVLEHIKRIVAETGIDTGA